LFISLSTQSGNFWIDIRTSHDMIKDWFEGSNLLFKLAAMYHPNIIRQFTFKAR